MSTKSLGILVGGGPAPGLNGVISAVTIAARRSGLEVYGIYDGYKWLTKGDPAELEKHVKKLDMHDVAGIHFLGGSILRTSRTNPSKVENGIPNAVKMLDKLGITYMVTTGGDDTAYGASQIALASEGRIKFAHVPKTIDNDLPLPHGIPTFGYQTARHVGSALIKNLMEDGQTTGRWYTVVAMGRHAGHLTLGMAKSAGATLAIIPEEFPAGKISFKHVCDIFETSILKRKVMGENHGVLVIAEGVSDRLVPEDLEKATKGNVSRDAFGNIQLADVELGKIIKQEIEARFEARGESFRTVEIDLGYVLRCAEPIPFDQEYTRDLGYQAVSYLLSQNPAHQKNAMICVHNGALIPLPFEEMIDPKTKKTAVRMVDASSDSYKVAREYMIRLEKRDFEDKAFLEKLAKATKMTADEFTKRYGYLAGIS